MNYAILGQNVGFQNSRPVDLYLAVNRLDGHGLALDGFGGRKFDHVGRRGLRTGRN